MKTRLSWADHKVLFVEIFVTANFAILVLDIYLAHSFNAFVHWAEWIPFYFSGLASVILTLAVAWRRQSAQSKIWHRTGFLIGSLSIVVGVTGLLFHLDSQFFAEISIKNLVYTAPFSAPLSYVGLGFLLLLNRMVDAKGIEWGQWLILLALGGFLGNFVLSLCDHAQSGFFDTMEWIPVWSSAFAVGFLALAMLVPADSKFLRLCGVLMGVQIIVGIAGFGFHAMGTLQGPSEDLFDNIIYGAPLLAPLLFPNLAVLALFGLGDLWARASVMRN